MERKQVDGHEAGAQATRASGHGVVHAISVVARAPSAELRAHAPYAIVLIDAAEGFRMMAQGDMALAIGEGQAAEGALDQIDRHWTKSEAAQQASWRLEATLADRPAWVRSAVSQLLDKMRASRAGIPGLSA